MEAERWDCEAVIKYNMFSEVRLLFMRTFLQNILMNLKHLKAELMYRNFFFEICPEKSIELKQRLYLALRFSFIII